MERERDTHGAIKVGKWQATVIAPADVTLGKLKADVIRDREMDGEASGSLSSDTDTEIQDDMYRLGRWCGWMQGAIMTAGLAAVAYLLLA